MSDQAAGLKSVRIWDGAVRIFHWLLVIAIASSWWTNQQLMIDFHALAGYSILALIVFRVLWGFIGSSNARFANFLKGPSKVVGYFRKLLGPSDPTAVEVGHNPAGGWMVAIMLVLVAVQAISGLFASEDTFLFFDGPLVAYVSPKLASTMNFIHHTNITLIYIAVALHVCAVVFYRVVRRDNLIKAMVTGYRDVPESQTGRFAKIRFVSGYIGIGLLIVCGAAVWVFISVARNMVG